jgi:hypothetical protein
MDNHKISLRAGGRGQVLESSRPRIWGSGSCRVACDDARMVGISASVTATDVARPHQRSVLSSRCSATILTIGRNEESVLGDVTNRLLASMNAHDVDAFVACFAPGYRSEQPAHPSRAFEGSNKVRENWTSVFSGVPDFDAELLLSAITGTTVSRSGSGTGGELTQTVRRLPCAESR